MTIDFSQYLACLKADPAHGHAQRWNRAITRPRGLEHYLTGIRAMCDLNKGPDPVLTYVQEMPGVAKEIGEDIIPDVVSALMKLASHTSGTVILMIMATLPLAASRSKTGRSPIATTTTMSGTSMKTCSSRAVRRGAGSERRGARHDRHPARGDAGSAHQYPHHPPCA